MLHSSENQHALISIYLLKTTSLDPVSPPAIVPILCFTSQHNSLRALFIFTIFIFSTHFFFLVCNINWLLFSSLEWNTAYQSYHWPFLAFLAFNVVEHILLCGLLWCCIFQLLFLNLSSMMVLPLLPDSPKLGCSILDPLLFSISISPRWPLPVPSSYILSTCWWIPRFIPIRYSSVNSSDEHLPRYSTSTLGCSISFKQNKYKDELWIFVHSYIFLSPEFSLNHVFSISVTGTFHPVAKPKA